MDQVQEGKVRPKVRESLVITDDQTWLWQFASKVLSELEKPHVRLPSGILMTPNWQRFRNTPHLLVHWESTSRRGGAIIEDLKEADPDPDMVDRVIVMTESPTHEDIVYLSELGVSHVIRLRPREKDLANASKELKRHLTEDRTKSKNDLALKVVLRDLEALGQSPPLEQLKKIRTDFDALEMTLKTARSLDIEALFASFGGEDQKALGLWTQALEKNPNYYTAYHHLVAHHRRQQQFEKAYAILTKLHELNRSNISRLVTMGEVQKELSDLDKAESHFKSALEHDQNCSRALNGLAEIRFEQGKFEESRDLLSRSQLAFKTAANLNKKGVDLVKAKQYEDALKHYMKAQYVLPIQEKGPFLFYNIGLCYFRWGKPELAREFVKLALIKNPTYSKAQKLLHALNDDPKCAKGPKAPFEPSPSGPQS